MMPDQLLRDTQQKRVVVPCSLSMGNFHSLPSTVHRIISSNALLGGRATERSESSASSLSNNVEAGSRGSSAKHQQNANRSLSMLT